MGNADLCFSSVTSSHCCLSPSADCRRRVGALLCSFWCSGSSNPLPLEMISFYHALCGNCRNNLCASLAQTGSECAVKTHCGFPLCGRRSLSPNCHFVCLCCLCCARRVIPGFAGIRAAKSLWMRVVSCKGIILIFISILQLLKDLLIICGWHSGFCPIALCLHTVHAVRVRRERIF